MKKNTFLIAILFSSFIAMGQNLLLDVHSNKFKDFVAHEKLLKSKRVESETQYISLEPDVAQPEIYRRAEKNLPDLLTYIFYRAQDSAISYVLYEWDAENMQDFNKKGRAPFSDLAINNFIARYNELYTQIAAKYGKSEQKGVLGKASEAMKGIERSDSWAPDDSTTIDMYVNHVWLAHHHWLIG